MFLPPFQCYDFSPFLLPSFAHSHICRVKAVKNLQETLGVDAEQLKTIAVQIEEQKVISLSLFLSLNLSLLLSGFSV